MTTLTARIFKLRDELEALKSGGPDISGAKTSHEEVELRSAHDELLSRKCTELLRLLEEMKNLDQG